MLNECFRVLKPGGRIRVATPDLRALIGLYDNERVPIQDRYIDTIVKYLLPNVGNSTDSIPLLLKQMCQLRNKLNHS